MDKETKHKSFLKLWGSTPLSKVEEVRQQIIDKCFITRNIFYDWLSGRTEIPELYLQTIKQIYHDLQN